ncbi:MAG: right-handed parallel beta-helix repeat-containing protein [Actinomycetota bacterium]|nr:right-handed parallel beta-helix repeat-containing protein [Actinomycetota bacterium]
MAMKLLVSRTARRGHRSITSALHAAAVSRRAAVVRIEPGHYQETLTIRGEVELVAAGDPGSVVVSAPQGTVVAAFGAVRLSGVVLIGSDGDTVFCDGGTLTIEHSEIRSHSGVSVYAAAGASVVLRDSVITRGRAVFAGAVGLVERCRFIDAADNALAVIEGADVVIRDNWVGNSRIHGIRVSGARARITGCELTGTGDSSISADGRADVAVEDCRITAVHATGISFTEQSRGSVRDTRVVDAEHGIAVLNGANPLVQRCVFDECRQSGINVHSQGLGRFEDCAVGRAGSIAVFSTTGGAPEVHGCRVSGGNVGVAVVNGRGSFSKIEIRDLTTAALRVLESATAKFTDITVTNCPSGLESAGDGDTRAELTGVAFRDFSQAAVTVLGQSRVTLRNTTAERGTIGFGVGESAHLLMRDCDVTDVELVGTVVFGEARLTATNLTVTRSRGFGLQGQDSTYLDVTDSEFIDSTLAGISLDGSCGGVLARCSVTGSEGAAVVDNGRVRRVDFRSSLPITEQVAKPASEAPATIVQNFYGPVFNAAVEGVQLAWNNENVVQHGVKPPDE